MCCVLCIFTYICTVICLWIGRGPYTDWIHICNNKELYQYWGRGFNPVKCIEKKVREKSRECHNRKPQPFPDPKRKRKPTNPNKHKSNKRTKSTKISSLFPKRGNRNTKRTEKDKNKITHGKTYNNSPRRINHKQQRVRLTPRNPGIATITEHNILLTPRGTTVDLLSQLRLFRIPVCLEVKIWSLF